MLPRSAVLVAPVQPERLRGDAHDVWVEVHHHHVVAFQPQFRVHMVVDDGPLTSADARPLPGAHYPSPASAVTSGRQRTRRPPASGPGDRVVTAFIVGNHHAWLAYRIAATRRAVRGDLPWDVMRFLDDAHRLGLLRAVGPVYQFRHAELQDHLAAQYHPSKSRGRRPIRPPRVGGRTVPAPRPSEDAPLTKDSVIRRRRHLSPK
jgi:hypothetical protein